MLLPKGNSTANFIAEDLVCDFVKADSHFEEGLPGSKVSGLVLVRLAICGIDPLRAME